MLLCFDPQGFRTSQIIDQFTPNIFQFIFNLSLFSVKHVQLFCCCLPAEKLYNFVFTPVSCGIYIVNYGKLFPFSKWLNIIYTVLIVYY